MPDELDKTIDTNMNTIEPTKKVPKQRATVEYNGMELVLALLILYKDINNYDEVLQKIQDMKENPGNYILTILFNDPNLALGENTDLKNYHADIIKKKIIVNKFITGFRILSLDEILQINKIKHIYISGKKNRHAKINELNKGYDPKAAKGDIYIEYTDESMQIMGLSVKQSQDATKSNYSVHKMLGKDLDKTLTKIKKDYLKENGFDKFDKAQRPEVNKLFYPQNKENPYWLRVREEVSKNKDTILPQLLDSLYCSNVNYDIYEFDGTSFAKLNNHADMSSAKFEEHLPYYFDKKGKERETAKLFYRLTAGEKNYRVEVRWKGNIYNAAPQFQIHNDDDHEDKE